MPLLFLIVLAGFAMAFPKMFKYLIGAPVFGFIFGSIGYFMGKVILNGLKINMEVPTLEWWGYSILIATGLMIVVFACVGDK